jgi:hypothetical protein
MGTTSGSGGDSSEILRQDYQLKVNYLTEHFGRMWTRFNFMLSIQLALFGFLGYLLFDNQNRNVPAALLPIVLGLITALLWFFVGVQDRFLVEEYRHALIEAFKRLRQTTVHAQPPWTENDYVGFHQGQNQLFHRRGWLSWYLSPASITTLPAWIPLFALLVWLAALGLWLSKALWFA